MESIKLDQAAANYAPFYGEAQKRIAFKAGAQWQKEQLKYLIHAATNAANICEDCGDTITADILRKEIERFNS